MVISPERIIKGIVSEPAKPGIGHAPPHAAPAEVFPYLFANRPAEFSGTTPEIIAEDIARAHEKYGIPSDPDSAVARTLQAFNLQIYPSEIPSPARYISARIRHSGDDFPGFNYGSFVQAAEQVAFAKLRYGPINTEKRFIDGELVDFRVGGLAREAATLSTLAKHGYEVPALLGYMASYPENAEPSQANTLETLYIEAIPPERGTTRPPESWTPDLARMAADKIKTFDKPANQIELFQNEVVQLPVEVLLQRARIVEDDAYADALSGTIRDYSHLDTPIVAHGDTWLNNIIVSHDGTDMLFVDWELAGAGYRGQDAGRTLWGLTLDGSWNFAEIGDTARGFIDQWNESSEDMVNLRFGVGLESLRWIADRRDKLATGELTDDEARKLHEEVDAVKQHALKVLDEL